VVTRIRYICQTGDPFAAREDDDLQEFTVTIIDRDAEDAQGAGGSEEVRLFGVDVPARDTRAQRDLLLGVAARRFAAFAQPRRALAGSLSYARGAALSPGAVVDVSCRELIDDAGQPIPRALARVTSIERDALRQTCAVRLVYWSANTTGWAPSAKLDGAPAGAVVNCEANFYAPANLADGTQVVDLDFFEPGDAVLCVVPGDRAASAVRTISTRSGPNQVTLSAPPPAGTDRLRAVDYDTATARVRAFCYLATDAAQPTIPSVGDPAQIYT
jgi:hypothetical protein